MKTKEQLIKEKDKCPKCNYEWESKSKLIFVTCPSCQLKVRIKKDNKNNEIQHELKHKREKENAKHK